MGDTANDTASVGHVTDGDKPLPSTFKGPKFDPPVYRQRYAAVCELVKKQQAKKVLDREAGVKIRSYILEFFD